MIEMTLDQLRPGQQARVAALRCAPPLRRRLRELGAIEGDEICCLGPAPLGDPTAYLLQGAAIALRRRDCRDIEVEV